jgi:hypothetical protein
MSRSAKIFLLLGVVAFSAAPALFQLRKMGRATSSRPNEIYAVINAQWSEFRAANFAAAYRYATVAFQAKVPPAEFEQMVRSSYAGMMRADRIEFGALRDDGATALLQVLFFSPDGTVLPYVYRLKAEAPGWRIESVLPAPARPHPGGGLHI